MSFRWIPHTLPNAEAIQRLQLQFPKPNDPPPEAWFMGETSYYNSIIDVPVSEIPFKELEWYLFDTWEGLRCFPEVEFAIQSWKATFNYLLPYLFERCNEEYLLQNIIQYFCRLYPDTIPDIYPEFRSDVINTLGNMLMHPMFWGDDDLAQSVIQTVNYGANDFIRIMAPAMYFCIKYLTFDEIKTWVDSLVQIKGIHWHFNLMNWLFSETFQILILADSDADMVYIPPQHEADDSKYPNIEYQLPTANVKIFVEKLREHGLYKIRE